MQKFIKGYKAKIGLNHSEVWKAMLKFLSGDYSKYFSNYEIVPLIKKPLKKKYLVVGHTFKYLEEKKIIDLVHEEVIRDNSFRVYALNPQTTNILKERPQINLPRLLLIKY